MLNGRTLLRALLGAALLTSLTLAPVAQADPPLAGNKPCATVAPAPGATKFLIAGDSIVHESRGDYTWRYFLYKQLVAAGVNTDFVGDYNWLIDPNKSDWPYCDYQDGNFDTDFTAYPGLKLSDYNVANANTGNIPLIQNEVQVHQANVVVMLAGANDIGKGATAADTLSQAQQVVANARLGNPNIKIVLVANPTGGEYDNKPHAAYNALLKNAAPGWSTPNSPVVVADPMTGWGTSSRTWDKIHPNVVGEQLIASGIATALSSVGIGNPGVGVDPAYKIGLRNPLTDATATLNGSKIDLTWSLPIGASGVQVVARDTTGGVVGDWFQVIDYTWFPADIFGVGQCRESAPCTSYSITTLQPGHSYDIDLHAEKGFAIATDLWAVKQGETDVAGSASTTPGAWSFSIPGQVVLAKPAVVAAAGVHAVTLSWPAVAGANQAYKVRWHVVGSSTYGTTTAPGTSRSISGLAAGVRYGFQVAAVRDGVQGPWSDENFVTPKANVISALAKPVLRKVAGPKVKVTWRKATGATRYLLQFHQVGQPWRNVGWFTTLTSTSAKLKKKKSYEWRVVPYDGIVAGKVSPAARIKVK